MNSEVDLYLQDGCGRCKLYKTPQCKVHNWQNELKALRRIVLDCDLTEELKWRVPVYTFNNKNILILSAFKEFCSLSFIKGALMKDNNNLLHKQGESSQSARIMKFTNTEDILAIETVIKSYILEALAIEKEGLKVEYKKNLEPVPVELENEFEKDAKFKDAFYKLTQGKQRGYIIYFSQPKQSSTKITRIENSKQHIFNGIGINDKYKC
ncbi:MAG: DUF1801 domain-containing protein [Saprospiraceae bacterium]|nr:DUF1801 domain-containing protein [Saprospiraceae bacterium]